jgi:spore maturation protein CgeB
MERNELTDEQLKALEEENRQLREDNLKLLDRLRTYESEFHKELGARTQVIKKSWTWRIGNLFVAPVFFLAKPFFFKKQDISDRKTIFKSDTAQNTENQPGKPDFNFDNQPADPGKTSVAVIFDTFTQSCFEPEFNTIRFTPGNWRKVLETNPVRALFIESAWTGIEDSWKYKISDASAGDTTELRSLLKWAEAGGIPSIFWNKEDPVHFEHFIGTAEKFRFIFTSDAGCIAGYRKKAPGAVVNALPFAAQPLIHNPIATEPRSKPVCFAGTYYNQRYHERKSDMDFLLKPALDFGLEIFDRNFGKTGKNAGSLAFPEIYSDAIKGKLDYADMVKAYKQYKVFLNVNSVRYSPTMFARRVFELLASGTPVISTYSEGIVNILGEGTVFITDSEEDTRKHLDRLLNDELLWWKASLNGLRTVMENHTCADRTGFIFETAGLPYQPPEQVKFSVVSLVKTMEEIRSLEKILRHQTFRNFDLILVISGNEIPAEDQKNEIITLFEPLKINLFKENYPDLEKEIITCSDSGYLAFIHPDNYYGPEYLRDYHVALKYSKPPVLGKNSHFILENGNKLQAVNKGSEYRFVSRVPVSTSVHSKAKADLSGLRNYLVPGMLILDEPKILSIDPFNYLDMNSIDKQYVTGSSLFDNINL